MATTYTILQEDCDQITVTVDGNQGPRGPASDRYNYSAPEAITAWQETMVREMPGLFNDPSFAARYGQTAPLTFPKPGMWDPDVMNDLATIWLRMKQEQAGINADGWLGPQTANALGDAYSFLRTLNGHDDHLHARNEWHNADIEFIEDLCGPDGEPDGGPDDGPDDGPDSGPDDGPDSGPDDGPDSGPDSGPEPITATGINLRPLGDSAHWWTEGDPYGAGLGGFDHEGYRAAAALPLTRLIPLTATEIEPPAPVIQEPPAPVAPATPEPVVIDGAPDQPRIITEDIPAGTRTETRPYIFDAQERIETSLRNAINRPNAARAHLNTAARILDESIASAPASARPALEIMQQNILATVAEFEEQHPRTQIRNLRPIAQEAWDTFQNDLAATRGINYDVEVPVTATKTHIPELTDLGILGDTPEAQISAANEHIANLLDDTEHGIRSALTRAGQATDPVAARTNLNHASIRLAHAQEIAAAQGRSADKLNELTELRRALNSIDSSSDLETIQTLARQALSTLNADAHPFSSRILQAPEIAPDPSLRTQFERTAAAADAAPEDAAPTTSRGRNAGRTPLRERVGNLTGQASAAFSRLSPEEKLARALDNVISGLERAEGASRNFRTRRQLMNTVGPQADEALRLAQRLNLPDADIQQIQNLRDGARNAMGLTGDELRAAASELRTNLSESELLARIQAEAETARAARTTIAEPAAAPAEPAAPADAAAVTSSEEALLSAIQEKQTERALIQQAVDRAQAEVERTTHRLADYEAMTDIPEDDLRRAQEAIDAAEELLDSKLAELARANEALDEAEAALNAARATGAASDAAEVAETAASTSRLSRAWGALGHAGRALGIAGVVLGPVSINATITEAQIKGADLDEAVDTDIVANTDDIEALERNSDRQITWAWIGGAAAAVGGVAIGVLTAPVWVPAAAVGATTLAVAGTVATVAGVVGTGALVASEIQGANMEDILSEDMDAAMRNVFSVQRMVGETGVMSDWFTWSQESSHTLITERYGEIGTGPNSDILDDGTLNMDLAVNRMRMDALNRHTDAELSPNAIPFQYEHPEHGITYDMNLTPFEMLRLLGPEATLEALKAHEQAKIDAGLDGNTELLTAGSSTETDMIALLQELDMINQFQEEAWDMTDLADDADNTNWLGYRHERTPAELVLDRYFDVGDNVTDTAGATIALTGTAYGPQA